MSTATRRAAIALVLATSVVLPSTTFSSVPFGSAAAAATTQQVAIGSSSYALSGVDVTRGVDQLVVYTRSHGLTASPANIWGAEAVVKAGVVVELVDRQVTGAAGTAIPEGSVLLSGHGAARDWLLAHARPGRAVSLPSSVPAPSEVATSWSVAHRLSGTNVKRGTDQLVVYTRTSTQTSSPANQWGAEAVVSGGSVTALVDRQTTGAGATAIPSGSVVLSGHGGAREWLLRYARVGTKVALSTRAVTLSSAPPSATPTPTPTPAPAPAPAPTPVPSTYVADDFEGATLSPYLAPALNGSHPTWFAESGSDPVLRTGGVGVKAGKTQFFRMWTQRAVGGPGQSIRIKAKVRTTTTYVRDTGGIVEGTKLWLKWAHTSDEAYPGPASVRGIVDGTSPGSYVYSFHTHNGYNEIMKRAPGQETSSAYTFFTNTTAPYRLGTWEDVEMTVEWLSDGVRIRTYRNGVLQMEAVDRSTSRMLIPGYAGFRSDDSTFEVADFRVESF